MQTSHQTEKKANDKTDKEVRMLRYVLMGTAAGAVGTVTLNVTTYADMATRAVPQAVSQLRWPASS